MPTLYGVGVGPGDPELITLKAARLLSEARVVAYPANPKGDSLALSIAGRYLPPQAEHIVMAMDFVPDRQSANAAYDQGAETIAERLRAGHDVVVLCEGDPLLFGSFAYLLPRVPPETAVTVIPGISSLTACAAAAVRPLALGSQPLVCLPATLPAEDLDRALSGIDGVAVFKVGRHLPKVAEALARAGLAEGATCVIRASHQDQQVMPLAEALARPQGVPYFSMVLARRA